MCLLLGQCRAGLGDDIILLPGAAADADGAPVYGSMPLDLITGCADGAVR